MYSLFYRIIQKILLKRSFYDDFLEILKTENVNHIVEIGCADSIILKNLNKNFYYNGYDVVDDFIEKSKKLYSNNNKFKFEKKSIHEIDYKQFDSNKTIILLIGVFHHVNDEYIKIFLNNTKAFKVYAVDAVRLNDQKIFTKLLLDFDKGKFVRFENEYKTLLKDYDFLLARNTYLNFNYDHLISSKNLNNSKIKNLLKI